MITLLNRRNVLEANDTAEDVKPIKGIYLMTDIYGNQRKVKVTPAEKSLSIELLEKAPKLRTNDNYDTFLYKKGSVRLKYGDLNPLYCFNNMEFKLYLKEGSEPLYLEFESKK